MRAHPRLGLSCKYYTSVAAILLLEKGELAGGVRNFRFNESVFEALARVDGATAPAYAEGIVCPALRIRDFHFTEATDF